MKDVKYFLTAWKKELSILKPKIFNKNPVKIFENTLEQNNSAVTCCMEMLDSLNERVNNL